MLSAGSDAPRRASVARRLDFARAANVGLFAAVAAGAALVARAQGAYGAAHWAPLGFVLVAAAAALFIGGRRPPRTIAAAAGALALLGAWSLLSVVWGGLPHEAWRAFDLWILAAAALLVGSLLTSTRGRRELVASAVLAGLTAHALEVLVRLALPAHPDAWVQPRFIEGPVGYHTAQALVFALAVPLALWQADHRRAVMRAAGGASAAVLVSALFLTQSRGALIALGLGLAVQLARARSSRLAVLAALTAGAGAVLWLALREVDVALVEGGAADQLDALRRYGLWAAATSLALGTLAAFRPPPRVTRALAGAAAALALGLGIAALIARGEDLPRPGLLLSSLVSDVSPEDAPAGETRVFSLSSRGRVEAWRVARAMSAEKPLVGAGQGQFAREWALERKLTGQYILQPHSLELELTSELGIVGLALFAAFASFAAAALLRTSRREVSAAALGTGTVLLAQTAVDWTWSFPGVVAPGLLAIGSAAGSRSMRHSGWAGTIALGVLVTGLIAAFYVPYAADRKLAQALELEQHDPAQASQAAGAASRLDPWDARSVTLLARLAESSGRFELAAERYGKAARLSQQPWLDHHRQAQALVHTGDRAGLLAACRRAVLSNPGERRMLEGPCAFEDDGHVWPLVRTDPGQDAAGYDLFLTDDGCSGCSLSLAEDELEARVAGAVAPLDTAYAVREFGGENGYRERVVVRDALGLARSQTLSGNVVVLQVRDNHDQLVYELYIRGRDRTLGLFSHRGGLGPDKIDLNTGVIVPADGSSRLDVEVSARVADSLVLRVDGVARIRLAGLDFDNNNTTQRYLRVGILHYSGSETFEPVGVFHGRVRVREAR